MNDPTINHAKTAQSKILVLGATGGTGRLIVSQALARGYQVTALASPFREVTLLSTATRARDAGRACLAPSLHHGDGRRR